MKIHGPPRFLILLLAASILMGALPIANTYHEFVRWFAVRAQLNEAEQFETYETQWTNAPLLKFVKRVCDVVPEDARILLTPVGGDERHGKVRWHVFLNEALYPRQSFVRRPAMASGTAMQFAPWVDYHLGLELTGPIGETSAFEGGFPALQEEEQLAQQALKNKGVEWEIRYHLDSQEPFGQAVLLYNGKRYRSNQAGPQ